MEATEHLKELLERARQESGQWLETLQNEEEEPERLLPFETLRLHSPEERFSSEDESEKQDEDLEGKWSIGLAGHGWNNLYFCCFLRSPRLKIAIQVPYQTPLTGNDEMNPAEDEMQNRRRMRVACSLVCHLLTVDFLPRNGAQNHPQAALAVTFDKHGCSFCLRDGENLLRKGTNLKELLFFLDPKPFDSHHPEETVIFFG